MIDGFEGTTLAVADSVSSMLDWMQQRRAVAQAQRQEAVEMRARTACARLALGSRRPSAVDAAALRRRLALAERKASGLEVALASNRRIGMALGVLMARHRLTEVQAFDQLRQYSNRRNVKLAVVAEEVLYTGELSGLPA
jgi:hypothetical protein